MTWMSSGNAFRPSFTTAPMVSIDGIGFTCRTGKPPPMFSSRGLSPVLLICSKTFRAFSSDAPVFRIAALRSHVEGDAGEVGAQPRRRRDDFAGVSRTGAELPGKRPIAADVGRRDAQVLLRIGLHLEHAAQLL